VRRRGIPRLLLALLLAGVVLLGAPVRAGAAPAQEPTATTSTEGDNPEAPEQDIIPRPDSGTEPDDAGDRGGALQLVVLAAVVVGVGTVVALGVRESRRNRRSRAAA
jgi:uncharacterized membrane protein YedE/YeeE